MSNSRTINSLKNIGFGYIGKLFSIFLSFVSRTIFIQILGATYLGVNGLFTNILGVLSLTELGISTAINYSLYKPVAMHDEVKIRALMRLYKKAYRIIALSITALGLAILPFLPYFIKGFNEIPDIQLYYVIFLFNTVSTYFVSYKYGLVNAEQKNYILTNIETLSAMVITVVQMIALLAFHSFLVYLLVQAAFQLLQKIITAMYLNKKYARLLTNFHQEQVDFATKKRLIQDIKALILERVSNAAVYQSDNIIIGMFISITAVGIVSNYDLIMMTGIALLNIPINGVISSCGNFLATKKPEEGEYLFDAIDFFGSAMFGVASILCFVMLPDFIHLWLGPDMMMDDIAFSIMALNFYLVGQRAALMYFRVAGGVFVPGRYASLVQAFSNIIISVIGAQYLGLAGIYIGTVLSGLVIMIWRPIVMYKALFHSSSKIYFIRMGCRFILNVFLAIMLCFLRDHFPVETYLFRGFIPMCLFCIVVPIMVYIIIYHRKPYFQYIYIRFKNVVSRT